MIPGGNDMSAPGGPRCACGSPSQVESGACLRCAKLAAAEAQRDALWRLLDDVDTLDDACREDDAAFRKRAYATQRKRFDIYTPADGPVRSRASGAGVRSSLPPSVVLQRIDREHREWSDRNFGVQSTLEKIAGMAEEYGEACEAMGDRQLFLDAVSDFFLYFLHYCRMKGWPITELWAERLAHTTPGRAWPQLLGKLAHHELKTVQGIRGTPEFHSAAGRGYAAALLRHLEHVCAQMGEDLVSVVAATWAEVRERDWNKERETNE